MKSVCTRADSVNSLIWMVTDEGKRVKAFTTTKRASREARKALASMPVAEMVSQDESQTASKAMCNQAPFNDMALQYTLRVKRCVGLHVQASNVIAFSEKGTMSKWDLSSLPAQAEEIRGPAAEDGEEGTDDEHEGGLFRMARCTGDNEEFELSRGIQAQGTSALPVDEGYAFKSVETLSSASVLARCVSSADARYLLSIV